LKSIGQQIKILEHLQHISDGRPSFPYPPLHFAGAGDKNPNLTEDKSLREFWARCTDQNLLYIQPEKLVTCLDQKYGAQLKSKYERDPKRGINFR
jgi:hypothetical protein